jgi:hypothetical protein
LSATRKLDPAEKDRARMLRNLGYRAGRAGQPPSELHADDPVYMESWRRGVEARRKV